MDSKCDHKQKTDQIAVYIHIVEEKNNGLHCIGRIQFNFSSCTMQKRTMRAHKYWWSLGMETVLSPCGRLLAVCQMRDLIKTRNIWQRVLRHNIERERGRTKDDAWSGWTTVVANRGTDKTTKVAKTVGPRNWKPWLPTILHMSQSMIWLLWLNANESRRGAKCVWEFVCGERARKRVPVKRQYHKCVRPALQLSAHRWCIKMNTHFP